MSEQIPDFKNFSSVWERVEARSQNEDNALRKPLPKAEKPPKRRAERFLPKF